jgi:hypothetical protein
MIASLVAGTATQLAVQSSAASQAEEAQSAFMTQPEGGELAFAALNGEYRLRRAITLSISVEDGLAVARWADGELEGRGATLHEALAKFRARLEEAAIAGRNAAVQELVVRTAP